MVSCGDKDYNYSCDAKFELGDKVTFNLSGSDWYWFYTHIQEWRLAHYPPWTYLFLYPLSLPTLEVSYVLLLLLSIVIVHHYMKSPVRTALFFTSSPALISLLHGNIDLLLVTAFTLPLSLGLLVCACKPQAMLGWMIRKALNKPLSGTLLVVVVGVSLIVWPGWYLNLINGKVAWSLNLNRWWPLTIPVGLALLLGKSELSWLGAGAFLSPFITVYHLAPMVAVIAKRLPLWVVTGVNVALWVVTIMMRG